MSDFLSLSSVLHDKIKQSEAPCKVCIKGDGQGSWTLNGSPLKWGLGSSGIVGIYDGQSVQLHAMHDNPTSIRSPVLCFSAVGLGYAYMVDQVLEFELSLIEYWKLLMRGTLLLPEYTVYRLVDDILGTMAVFDNA